MGEPSVRHSDTQREGKKTDGASSEICDQGGSVWPPREVPNQHSNEKRLQQTEEEHEDEEEEVKEKESSGPAATKQVPIINVDAIKFAVTRVCFGQPVGPRIKV